MPRRYAIAFAVISMTLALACALAPVASAAKKKPKPKPTPFQTLQGQLTAAIACENAVLNKMGNWSKERSITKLSLCIAQLERALKALPNVSSKRLKTAQKNTIKKELSRAVLEDQGAIKYIQRGTADGKREARINIKAGLEDKQAAQDVITPPKKTPPPPPPALSATGTFSLFSPNEIIFMVQFNQATTGFGIALPSDRMITNTLAPNGFNCAVENFGGGISNEFHCTGNVIANNSITGNLALTPNPAGGMPGSILGPNDAIVGTLQVP